MPVVVAVLHASHAVRLQAREGAPRAHRLRLLARLERSALFDARFAQAAGVFALLMLGRQLAAALARRGVEKPRRPGSSFFGGALGSNVPMGSRCVRPSCEKRQWNWTLPSVSLRACGEPPLASFWIVKNAPTLRARRFVVLD